MTIKWTEASPAIISAAQDLINQHHAELDDARIGFVERSEPAITAGHSVSAGVQLVPAKMQVHLEFDFLIWVCIGDWLLADKQKRSRILDHVLYHCGRDSASDKWYIRRHDIEEFTAMIQRYGFEDPWVARAAGEALQLPLIAEKRGVVESIKPEQLNHIAQEVEQGLSGKVKVEVKSFGVEAGPTTDEELYKIAVALVKESEVQPTASALQRKLRIGYPKAARLIDRMEEEMIITIPDENGVRILVSEKVLETYQKIQALSPAAQEAAGLIVAHMAGERPLKE